MISVTTVITIVSVAIAFISVTIAILSFLHNRDNDKRSEVRDNVEIHAGLQSQIEVMKTNMDNQNKMMTTQLGSIDSGVRDLRADNRGFRAELTKMRDDLRDEMRDIHDEALHAVELAEAAHRRLDRMGADPDPGVKKLTEGD